MPRIFDNIGRELLPALRASLEAGRKADFCALRHELIRTYRFIIKRR